MNRVIAHVLAAVAAAQCASRPAPADSEEMDTEGWSDEEIADYERDMRTLRRNAAWLSAAEDAAIERAGRNERAYRDIVRGF